MQESKDLRVRMGQNGLEGDRKGFKNLPYSTHTIPYYTLLSPERVFCIFIC